MARLQKEPEQVFGFCCGCQRLGDRTLYRVEPSRYRCIDCNLIELYGDLTKTKAALDKHSECNA